MEIISLGDQLMNDPSIIKDLIQFSDEELTDEKVEEKLEETLARSTTFPRHTRRSSNCG